MACASRLARRRWLHRVLLGVFVGLFLVFHYEEDVELVKKRAPEPSGVRGPRDFRARAHVQDDGSAHPLHAVEPEAPAAVEEAPPSAAPVAAAAPPTASASGSPVPPPPPSPPASGTPSPSGAAGTPSPSPPPPPTPTGSGTPGSSPSGPPTPTPPPTPSRNPCRGAVDPLPPGCLKVVVLSMYGNRTRYTSMVTVYARAIAALAPDWSLWVYTDAARPSPPEVLAELQAAGATLVPARTDLTRNGMMWRFLAADDPRVARFAARDADARFTLREAWSLRAWEESGLPFHAQRDHGAHFDMSLPLGGMWGAVGGALPSVEGLMRQGHNAQAEARGDVGWGADMLFLRSEVTPLMLQAGVLEHVPSVGCAPASRFTASPRRAAQPFPRAGYEFLGSEGVRVDHMLGLERLPQAHECPADGVPPWNRTTSRALALLPRMAAPGAPGGGVGAVAAVGSSRELADAVAAAVAPSASGRRAFAPLGSLEVLAPAVGHAASGVTATVVGSAAVTVTRAQHRVGRDGVRGVARVGAVHHYRGLMPLTSGGGGGGGGGEGGAPTPESVAAAVPFLHEQFPLGYHKRTAYEEAGFVVVPTMAVVLLPRGGAGEGAAGAGGGLPPAAAEAIRGVLGHPQMAQACLLVLVEGGPARAPPQAMTPGGPVEAPPAGGLHLCGGDAPRDALDERLCALGGGGALPPPCLTAESAARAAPAPGPPDVLKEEITWWARDIVVLTAPEVGGAAGGGGR